MARGIRSKQLRLEPAWAITAIILLLLLAQTVFAQRAVQVQVDGRTIYTPSFQYRAANGQTFTVPIIPAESIEQMIRNKPTNPNEIRIWAGPKNVFFVDTGANRTPQIFAKSGKFTKGVTYGDSATKPRNYFTVNTENMSNELRNIVEQSKILLDNPNWSVIIAKRWPEDFIQAIRQTEFLNGNRDRAAIEQKVEQEVSKRAASTIRHEATHAFINNDDVFFNRVRSIWFNELSSAEREFIIQQWGGKSQSLRILNEKTGAWQILPDNIKNALIQAWGSDVDSGVIHEFGAYLIGNRNYSLTQELEKYPQGAPQRDFVERLKRKLDMISQQSATDPAFAALNSEKPVQGIASTQQPRPTTGTRNTEPIPQPQPSPRPQPTQQPKPTPQPQPQSQPEPTSQPEPAQQEPLPEIPKEPSFVLPREPELSNCENIIDCLNNLTKLINFQIYNSLPKEEAGKQ